MTDENVEEVVVVTSALDNVVSSSLSESVLAMISGELSAISLGRNIAKINNKHQAVAKSTPGEFPALILKPKRAKPYLSKVYKMPVVYNTIILIQLKHKFKGVVSPCANLFRAYT